LLPDDVAIKGQLLPVAARLVMKLMWLCRTARPDVTFAVNTLAKHMTIWSVNDDNHPSWMQLSPICVFVYPVDFALPCLWIYSQRPKLKFSSLQVAKRTIVAEMKLHPQNLLDFQCLFYRHHPPRSGV
jgi:hypothetical protein